MSNWKDFELKSTEELIQIIKESKTQKQFDLADAVFHAFCFRFSESITKKCEIICANNNYDAIFAVEVSKKTFERFWKYPNYKHEKSKASSFDKGVLLYLFKIATNVFRDLIKERLNANPYNGGEQIIKNIPMLENASPEQKQHYQLLLEVFKSFSDKHRIIFLTYKSYEQEGKKLPRKLLNELRDELKLSQTTIRSYKYEVYQKIEEIKRYGKKN